MQIPQTVVVASVKNREIYRAILPPGEYVIGRDLGAAIRLDSNKISRRHGQLMLNYFDWLIEDFGSVNGTRVGGMTVTEPTLIFPQQELEVGDVNVKLSRLRSDDDSGSIAPQTEAVLRFLPREFRGERKYKVRGIIAIGGMGVVLEAEDTVTHRVVAMKTVMGASSPENLIRFIEEARITAQLEHPHIVPVYELSVNELGLPFYVMKLVRGHSLRSILHNLRLQSPSALKGFPLSELLAMFQKVCDAIGYAHSKGVIHRDLKPANVMEGEFGATLVMDWGLAKALGAGLIDDPAASVRTVVSSLRQEDPEAIVTADGVALGTPEFMSPEQASGCSGALDGRVDIYALGAILYNMLTLRPPVYGTNAEERLNNAASGRIVPPHAAVRKRPLEHLPDGRLPEALVHVALKAMSLKPQDRYQTVRELQADVRRFQFSVKRS